MASSGAVVFVVWRGYADSAEAAAEGDLIDPELMGIFDDEMLADSYLLEFTESEGGTGTLRCYVATKGLDVIDWEEGFISVG
jgi:hypothetical protein